MSDSITLPRTGLRTGSRPVPPHAEAQVSAPPTPLRVWLILGGIALNTVFTVLADRSMRGDPETATIGDLLLPNVPAWAATVGRVSIVMILVAALLCAASSARRNVGRPYQFLLWAYVGYSLILAARTLGPEEYLTSVIYSPLAPVCALASCLLFASADKETWQSLIRLVVYGTVGVAVIILFEIARAHVPSRGAAYWYLYVYASILEVAAIVAFGWFAQRGRGWLGIFPMAVLVAATILMQTRLMLVELVCLVGFYTLLRRPKLSTQTIITLCVLALAAMWIAYAVWYSPKVQSMLPDSAIALWDRWSEDTRTEQFVTFFQKVPGETFVWGIGIPHVNDFSGMGSEGIDFGYINILFIGGIPALLLFFLLHIWPAVRSVGSRLDPVDAACVASVLTYGVRLLSSTVPTLAPNYCILLLLVGRCIMLVQERKTSRAAYPSRPAVWQLNEGG